MCPFWDQQGALLQFFEVECEISIADKHHHQYSIFNIIIISLLYQQTPQAIVDEPSLSSQNGSCISYYVSCYCLSSNLQARRNIVLLTLSSSPLSDYGSASFANTNSSPNAESGQNFDIKAWLDEINCKQYYRLFKENDVKSLDLNGPPDTFSLEQFFPLRHPQFFLHTSFKSYFFSYIVSAALYSISKNCPAVGR